MLIMTAWMIFYSRMETKKVQILSNYISILHLAQTTDKDFGFFVGLNMGRFCVLIMTVWMIFCSRIKTKKVQILKLMSRMCL